MNKIIVLLLMVFAGFSAQAMNLPNHPDGLVPVVYNLKLDSDTQVVELNVQTRNAISCPGTLDLKISRNYRGQVTVVQNTEREDAILGLMESVSSSCAKEIWNQTQNPGLVCLSYGHERGRVYVEVRNLPEELDRLSVVLPLSLELTGAIQLK